MHETSKAVQRRLHDVNFVTRYFRGDGIDIGAGNDGLDQYTELFPFISSVRTWDRQDGDAQHMDIFPSEYFDFVHSSHCLEDMENPEFALKNWLRILKPGGYLIVTVPDEDMYEQGVFPSTFNRDHKWTFTIFKGHSWNNPKSINIVDLIRRLDSSVEVIKIEQLISTYRFSLDRQDQTRNPIAEAAIEFVIRKRGDNLKNEPASIIPGRMTYIKRPKIALHRPGAIGDIIMTLSLVPLLKEKYPEHDIFYFCNSAIGESLKRLMKLAGVKGGYDCARLEEKRGEFDKVFNLIGYPLHEGYPEKPMQKHLIEYFADEMGLENIRGDLHVQGPLPYLTLEPDERPTEETRYATIHPQAGWSAYKNWQQDRWEKIIAARPDIPFFQIGGENDMRLKGADDIFMGQPLEHSIDLMAHATLHLGVDSWTNHLTNIFWSGRGFPDSSGGFTPAIILWGSTQCSAAGYARNTNISLGLPCQPCFREDPKISRMPRGPCINPPGQDYDHPKHACMAGITVDMVLAEIERLWPCRTGSPTP